MNKEIKRDAIIGGAIIAAGIAGYFLYKKFSAAQAGNQAQASQSALDNAALLEQLQAYGAAPMSLSLPSLPSLQASGGASVAQENPIDNLTSEVNALMQAAGASPASSAAPNNQPSFQVSNVQPTGRGTATQLHSRRPYTPGDIINPVGPEVFTL